MMFYGLFLFITLIWSAQGCSPEDSQNNVTLRFMDIVNVTATCEEWCKDIKPDTLCRISRFLRNCCNECPRSKVDYNQQMNVEVKAVYDFAVVERYVGFGYRDNALDVIEEEIQYYFKHMNVMYESLANYGLQLQLRLTGIEFVGERIVNETDLSNGNQVEDQVMLANFQRDVHARGKGVADVAVLFTGYDLTSTNAGRRAEGLANIGKVCYTSRTHSPIAVLEMHGTFLTARIGSHEIGHILGAKHDNGDCLDGYIMTNITRPGAKNRWDFSKCSANYMKTHLEYLSVNCLTDYHAVSDRYLNADPQDLDIMKPENICLRSGKNNGYTKYEPDPSLYDECLTIQCAKPTGSKKEHIFMSSDGMECLKDLGVCSKGSCETNLG